MISIPEELLEQVERHNVIPIVGSYFNQGVLPMETELARELAARCAYPADEAHPLDSPGILRRVSGYYLLTKHDRHGLITFLRRRLDTSDRELSRSHRLLVQLHPRVLVTTCYDDLLEQAVQEASLPYTAVVRNEEVAYDDDEQLMLVWLRGTLDQPDTMIITEDDHRRFLSGRESLSDVLRGELARRTWLFVGFDPDDEWFPSYYDSVTQGLDHHRRRSYVLGTSMSEYSRAWWAERAHILDLELEPFLVELVRQLAARQKAEPAKAHLAEVNGQEAQPLPNRPYKLLDFYETGDAALFFGRNAEIQRLSSLIHAHRLVLLYGASGTGKTSLLLAGVIPRLQQADAAYEIIYLRALESPTTLIRRIIQRRFPEVKFRDEGSLVDLLQQAGRATQSTFVIVLDQFEEFFIRFGPQLRKAFISELGALYEARSVPVKIVLSLREDRLASVNEIRERIPEAFYNDLRLLPLSRQQAREAITAPAEQLGIRYDQSLVVRLLDELVEAAVDNADGFVMPPQLQLVCDAIYEHARSQGRHFISMTDYESVGGSQGILVRYIEEALREHWGRERKAAKDLLMALITSHGTKAMHDLEYLAAQVAVEKAQAERVLSRLTAQRLVRRLDEGQGYELAHDILAQAIADWVDEEDRQLKQIREMLQREVADWHLDPEALPGQAKFRRINAFRDSLRFSKNEAIFLLRAAIHHNAEVPYWLAQVHDPNSSTEILLDMLENGTSQARRTAASHLPKFPGDRVAVALARSTLKDPLPEVREAASVALAQMDGRGGIDFLQEAAARPEGDGRQRALRALAVILDMSLDRYATISRLRRLPLVSRVAQIRLRREWPRIRSITIAGAAGGALAFGSGLGLVHIVHALQDLRSATAFSLVTFAIFMSSLLAVFGLLAGAIMAFGIGAGEALLREKARLGRVLGGALLGGLGFALVLSPLALGDDTGFPGILLKILGGGLLGVFIALGITLSTALSTRRAVILIGGSLGGTFGVPWWGMMGYKPLALESKPLFLLIVAGALTGAVIAAGIVFAETRWKQTASKDIKVEDRPISLPASSGEAPV